MKKFTKSGEGVIVMNPREGIVQPFEVTDWLDLRIGFLMSITQAGADDNTATLAQTISGDFLGLWDRFSIGVIDALGQTLIAYTNRYVGGSQQTIGNSILAASDNAIGTTNSNYWRPYNGATNGNKQTFQVIDSVNTRPLTRWWAGDGSQIHFAAPGGLAAGYATLLMIRLRRDNVTTRANVINTSIKSNTAGHNGDVLYTNTPTRTLLQTNLEAFPTTVQESGPIELGHVPSSLFWYWPFSSSRLRIHAAGVLKIAT